MKRLLMHILCIILIFGITIPVYAADSKSDSEKEVQVQYSNMENIECSKVLGDNKSIILSDGRVITFSSDKSEDDDIAVVTTLINESESDALSYIRDKTAEFGNNPYAVYFGFYRNNQKITPKGKVEVTMTIPTGYSDAKLYFLKGDGTLTTVAKQTKNGRFEFELNENGYLIAVSNEIINGNNTSNDITVVQTGDANDIYRYVSLAAICGIILILGFGRSFIKKKRE